MKVADDTKYVSRDQGYTMAWLTPHAYLVRAGVMVMALRENDYFGFSFTVDGKQTVALARSHEHLLL
jgi:hypothetical protein